MSESKEDFTEKEFDAILERFLQFIDLTSFELIQQKDYDPTHLINNLGSILKTIDFNQDYTPLFIADKDIGPSFTQANQTVYTRDDVEDLNDLAKLLLILHQAKEIPSDYEAELHLFVEKSFILITRMAEAMLLLLPQKSQVKHHHTKNKSKSLISPKDKECLDNVIKRISEIMVIEEELNKINRLLCNLIIKKTPLKEVTQEQLDAYQKYIKNLKSYLNSGIYNEHYLISIYHPLSNEQCILSYLVQGARYQFCEHNLVKARNQYVLAYQMIGQTVLSDLNQEAAFKFLIETALNSMPVSITKHPVIFSNSSNPQHVSPKQLAKKQLSH